MAQRWRAVTRLAETQYGLVTREQCLESGLSDDALARKLTSGALVVVFPRVYRIAGSPPSRIQRLAAAARWVGQPNVISHSAAAEVLRLDGFPLRDLDAELHVMVLSGRRRSRAGVNAHRTLVLPSHHRAFVDGIACSSAARTVVDLATLVTGETLTAAAESARRTGIMSIAELQRVLRDLDHRRAGMPALRRYAEANRGQPALQYLLEVKLAKLLADSSLPAFVRQHPIRLADGSVVRVDFARPGIRLAVEAEGFRYHGTALHWKQDRRRVAALEELGWRVIGVIWTDVTERADATIERIALAMRDRAA